MNETTYTIFNLLRGSSEVIFEAYVCVAFTDNFRIKNKTLRFLIPIFLIYLAGINNTLGWPVDTFIFTPSMMILSVFLVNKDGIRRKLLILALMILPGILTLAYLELILYINGLVPGFDLNNIPESGIVAEYLRDYSELLISNFLVLPVLFRKKNRQLDPVIPVILLLGVVIWETAMILPILHLVSEGSADHSKAYIILTIVSAAVVDLLFIAFINSSEKLRKRESEDIKIKGIADFDREYYDLVKRRADELSVLRHDSVNFIEQIGSLIDSGDEAALIKARQMIRELEERL